MTHVLARPEADNGAVVVVEHRGRCDLRTVCTLARYRLAARRFGWGIRILTTSDQLRALIAFVGLDRVLVLESIREAERSEELGVDEVMQPGDPSA